MTQRDIADVVNISRKTVARKFVFLAERSKIENQKLLQIFCEKKITNVQFDELETHEHTKLKPISVAIGVEAKHRIILGLVATSMPAKGLLAKKSRKKYGPRKDDRKLGMKNLFQQMDPIVWQYAHFLSDKNPKYPNWIKSHRKTWRHETVKGRRGCIAGQGELKKIGYDPLFSLNHTCAMLRAKIARLIRRTWNTTKKLENLQRHLNIYMFEHNRKILTKMELNSS